MKMSNNMVAPLAIGAGTAVVAGTALPLAGRVSSEGVRALVSRPIGTQVAATAFIAGGGMIGAAVTSVLGQGEPGFLSTAAGIGASTLAGAGAGLLFGGVGVVPGAIAGAIGGVFGSVGAAIAAAAS